MYNYKRILSAEVKTTLNLTLYLQVFAQESILSWFAEILHKKSDIKHKKDMEIKWNNVTTCTVTYYMAALNTLNVSFYSNICVHPNELIIVKQKTALYNTVTFVIILPN